jgi:hypothetical protein
LIDRRWHLSIQDIRSFRGSDCDTDHYLVDTKFRKILAVNKQAVQNFDEERFNLRKLNELEFRKQYQLKISNRYSALEKLSDSENITRAWEKIKRISKIS